MKLQRKWWLPFALLLSACLGNQVYELNQEIPGFEWVRNRKLVFEVAVQDTQASYDLYINIRHTTEYPFTNLWINLYTYYPSGKQGKLQKQLHLASNKEGRWTGECMSTTCFAQLRVVEGLHLSETGIYRFEVEHIMRTNPLPGVMSVGLRLEKRTKLKS